MSPALQEVQDAVTTMPKPLPNRLTYESEKSHRAISRIEASYDRSRIATAFFAVRILGLALIVCSLPSGCASFAEVTDLKAIQETAGFYPKALFYCGSDEVCHFFEQETPLADLTILSKNVRTIMVARQEVRLPEGAEFLRSSYTGRADTRRQKLRIRITRRNPNRGLAEYTPSE